MKNKMMFTRRQLLKQGLGLVMLMGVSGCNAAPTVTPTVPPPTPTVMSNRLRFATPSDEGSFMYDFDKLVLTEALKRLGYSLELRGVPPVRAIELVENGDFDGDASRILSFGETHPKHVRVDAPTHALRVTAYATNPQIKVTSWDDLKTGQYQVGYLRGIKMLEDNLVGVVEAEKLFAVDSLEMGLRALFNHRLDVYVSASQFDMWNVLQTTEFADKTWFEAGDLAEIKLYPYLHQNHAALAPQLAATINQMRAEGVLDDYFKQLETQHFKKK